MTPTSRLGAHATTLAFAGVGGAWVAACAFGGLDVVVCPLRAVTGVPCPSCGATRAVRLLLDGQVRSAFLMNPVGPLLVAMATFAVVGVLRDMTMGTDGVRVAGRVMVAWLRRPLIARLAVLAVLANWAWNIQKGL